MWLIRNISSLNRINCSRPFLLMLKKSHTSLKFEESVCLSNFIFRWPFHSGAFYSPFLWAALICRQPPLLSRFSPLISDYGAAWALRLKNTISRCIWLSMRRIGMSPICGYHISHYKVEVRKRITHCSLLVITLLLALLVYKLYLSTKTLSDPINIECPLFFKSRMHCSSLVIMELFALLILNCALSASKLSGWQEEHSSYPCIWQCYLIGKILDKTLSRESHSSISALGSKRICSFSDSRQLYSKSHSIYNRPLFLPFRISSFPFQRKMGDSRLRIHNLLRFTVFFKNPFPYPSTSKILANLTLMRTLFQWNH